MANVEPISQWCGKGRETKMRMESSINYVKQHGSVLEQASLGVFLGDGRLLDRAIGELTNSQNKDGSWSPFWSPTASSIDATCCRLAICEQLSLRNEGFIRLAITFLAERQQPDGSFAEDEALASVAPVWAQPASTAARLYLTANTGFWLKYYHAERTSSVKAGQFLISNVNNLGFLPTFLHANWLAAGLFFGIGNNASSLSIMSYLSSRLPELNASNLAWMVNALVIMGVSAETPLIQSALSKLRELQHDDGHWESEDGRHYDVHTTFESLRAIRFGELAQH